MNPGRFFIRDIRKVSRRERIIAGISGTIIGGALICYMEYLEGEQLQYSLLCVGISIVAGIAAANIYNRYKARIEAEKNQTGNSFTGTIADEVEN